MDQATALALWSYDRESGVLTWRKSPNNSVRIGQEAGYLQKIPGGKTYRRVRTSGSAFMAHHIIWIMETGHLPTPPEQIDHQDGDGTNNRWKNLRLVIGAAQQAKNQRLRSTNTTGTLGVHYNKRQGNYQAYLSVNGRRRHLGTFPCLEDAKAAREAASKEFGFHANHGQRRPL